MNKAETEYVERLRAAITWLEEPFVSEDTPAPEMWTRIGLMHEDVLRAEAAFVAKTRRVAP